jgi:small subunit ribosomal protein S16
MVKIRLRRMGNKHRPFYRIVVAKSDAGRSGAFIEVLGTYNPLTKPKTVELDGDKALEWLRKGAQPTETTAYLLKQKGVLEKLFEERPQAKKDYKFLDKRTAVMTQQSVVSTVATAVQAETPAPEAVVAEEAPVAEALAEANEPVAEEAPAAEGTEEAKPE